MSGKQEQAERWVDRIDECLAGGDELTPRELLKLRAYLERIATTFKRKDPYSG